MQTASKQVVITRSQALQEHGIASITCLLSGLETFHFQYPEQDRLLRVAKGLYGLLVYATEFWAEYLLSCPDLHETIDRNLSGPLVQLACQLGDELERSCPARSDQRDTVEPADKRLMRLRRYGILWKHVNCALKARSPKSLETRILEDKSKSPIVTVCSLTNPFSADEESPHHSKESAVSDGISVLLNSYQEAVKSSMRHPFHPELSADELEYFKTHLGATAFTCRLTACPKATIGFDNENLLQEHERSHIRWFHCTSPGCQYPPLSSARALKTHISRYHDQATAPKPIRKQPLGRGKVGSSSTREPYNASARGLQPSGGVDYKLPGRENKQFGRLHSSFAPHTPYMYQFKNSTQRITPEPSIQRKRRPLRFSTLARLVLTLNWYARAISYKKYVKKHALYLEGGR